ncbi:hypothetical protein Anapl_06276 [Anas platyrhynchos]|uniref:Uncharacterized protein n=1 Tax=Anas platyrhynchos TaxID=8839 RepID=R0K2K1_ANAPL|nr:hypothetical protein Anapl_06276 [Anas platyrhynchos]
MAPAQAAPALSHLPPADPTPPPQPRYHSLEGQMVNTMKEHGITLATNESISRRTTHTHAEPQKAGTETIPAAALNASIQSMKPSKEVTLQHYATLRQPPCCQLQVNF